MSGAHSWAAAVRALLCRVVETDAFLDGMFQWASTLTTSGQNMPFALPLAADRTTNGFDISFLYVSSGDIVRTACISCAVELIEEVRLRDTLRAGSQT